MFHSQINVRYAKSLFLLAKEKNLVDEIKNDIELIFQALHEIPELIVLLEHPVVKISRKSAVLTDLFNEKIHEYTSAFLQLVIKNKRENHLKGMLRNYIDLYRQFKGIKTAEITTAIKLSDKEINEITKAIGQQFKTTVELKQKVNEDIIGGVIIEIENKQLDLSVAHYLERLKKEMLDFEIHYKK
ncbi:MAG TPA: ATP synthase F1 subunit delta [Bacteroidales bacterium]|nr:ATP synthase F1 subunit delta [Bacteroidales bacterium]